MIEKLLKVPVFRVFPEEVLKKLVPHITVGNYKQGDIIIKDGSKGNVTYIIDRGEVEIKKKNKILGIVSSGNIFGEMAFFDDSKRTADVIAREDTTLYEISSKDFKKFILEHPEHGVNFLFESMRMMARRLKHTSNYFVTVFETGKIVGGNYKLNEMAEKILNRLLEDIQGATGGMILVLNPFSKMYDIGYKRDTTLLDLEKTVELIRKNSGKNVYYTSKAGKALGIPVKEEENILAYIIIEKKGAKEPFSVEEEIIISTVGDQVGMGIFKAYKQQDEENRIRLEQHRVWKY